jgi:peptidyl-tRNA hydrolase
VDLTEDRLAMYFVVRKDARLTLGQGMAMAGAAADECRVTFPAAPAWETWWPRQRKIALRATAEELADIRARHPGVGDETLACLVPMRMSERSEVLASLRGFTDAKAPEEEPAPVADDAPAFAYVIRAGVMKTTGKAMAQAGHATVIAAAE